MSLLCLVCTTLPLLAASPAPGLAVSAMGAVQPPTVNVVAAGGAAFRELEREPEFSLAELEAGNASDSLLGQLALRGACAVLQARAEAHVMVERISGRPALYRLSFPKEPAAEQLRGPTKSALSALECARQPRD
ncbi:hypothetical protein [Inhella sp.]|uniref:hypothetical protein n=1 Tax=Inhella sp. TaxID=1921806 RepID=UPI0035AE655A